jgi:hypothetical protein
MLDAKIPTDTRNKDAFTYDLTSSIFPSEKLFPKKRWFPSSIPITATTAKMFVREINAEEAPITSAEVI